MINNAVCVCSGELGTELRTKHDVAPGEVLLQEPAFAYCSNEDEDGALPAMVQVAMDALIATEEEEEEKGARIFQDLVSCIDSDDPQKTALFAWGADQIMARRAKDGVPLSNNMSKDKIVAAIRRVDQNAFTVRSLVDPELDLDLDNFDLAHCLMQIGAEEEQGIGLYLLASAANHSCSPNAFVTFDSKNAIALRATQPIQAHEAITISYGPVAGVDGKVHCRREEILASHGFLCQCRACVMETASDAGNDFEALQFIERVIVGGNCTASEALLQATAAPDEIVQSELFGKAMSDTAFQSIEDINMAIGFQKLALKSMELRFEKMSPRTREHVTMAYELLRLLLFRFCCDGKNDHDGSYSMIERAREILRIHYGEDFPYKHTLATLKGIQQPTEATNKSS